MLAADAALMGWIMEGENEDEVMGGREGLVLQAYGVMLREWW